MSTRTDRVKLQLSKSRKKMEKDLNVTVFSPKSPSGEPGWTPPDKNLDFITSVPEHMLERNQSQPIRMMKRPSKIHKVFHALSRA